MFLKHCKKSAETAYVRYGTLMAFAMLIALGFDPRGNLIPGDRPKRKKRISAKREEIEECIGNYASPLDGRCG